MFHTALAIQYIPFVIVDIVKSLRPSDTYMRR